MPPSYLRRCISPGRHHNSKSQYRNREHLQTSVSLAANPSCCHCRDTTKAPKNDMNRYGDVESKRPVVQHIDREEQARAYAPFPERYGRRADEVSSIGVELVV
jgi:hypothetical protein